KDLMANTLYARALIKRGDDLPKAHKIVREIFNKQFHPVALYLLKTLAESGQESYPYKLLLMKLEESGKISSREKRALHAERKPNISGLDEMAGRYIRSGIFLPETLVTSIVPEVQRRR